jgi:hypothetical protein
MSASTVAHPRAMDIGEPQRKWHVKPLELPVPLPMPEREAGPAVPNAEPVPAPEPVGAPG